MREEWRITFVNEKFGFQGLEKNRNAISQKLMLSSISFRNFVSTQLIGEWLCSRNKHIFFYLRYLAADNRHTKIHNFKCRNHDTRN